MGFDVESVVSLVASDYFVNLRNLDSFADKRMARVFDSALAFMEDSVDGVPFFLDVSKALDELAKRYDFEPAAQSAFRHAADVWRARYQTVQKEYAEGIAELRKSLHS